MTKRLTDNLNSLYLGAAQRLRSKQARIRIIAYVESYDDVFFWRSLLSEFEDQHVYFEVMLPSRQTLAKGKKMVLMNTLGEKLGNYMIACVDADYDYLMQNANSFSTIINNNPYIIHTYVYAIDNYQCYAESLHEVCVMATLNDRKIVDFEEFIRLYSEIIYPLFVWSIWIYRQGIRSHFSLTDFTNIVALERVNIHHLENTLERVRRNVNRKIATLQHQFPQAKQHYNHLKQELLTLGVTPQTTYLYMQGHALVNYVVLPLLDPICNKLRRERETEIKQLACHNIQMDNELSSYQRAQESIDVMLRKHIYYKTSAPYQKMRADIRNLIKHITDTTVRPSHQDIDD